MNARGRRVEHATPNENAAAPGSCDSRAQSEAVSVACMRACVMCRAAHAVLRTAAAAAAPRLRAREASLEAGALRAECVGEPLVDWSQ